MTNSCNLQPNVLVFSNVGDWDSDSIGFIKLVTIQGELTEFTALAAAVDICGECATDDPEVFSAADKSESDDIIGETLDTLGMSVYAAPAFDMLVVFRPTDDEQPAVVGFVKV